MLCTSRSSRTHVRKFLKAIIHQSDVKCNDDFRQVLAPFYNYRHGRLQKLMEK
nr:MAG TPA: Lsm interaction motif [Caudoviricetes sp.]